MSARLDPAVWPLTARVDDGLLSVGGVRVDDLAREFGTPAYVLDEDDFRTRCRAWRGAFDGGDVYYAGKSFLCLAVVRWLAEEGLSLDVCSGGELAVARAAGFPADRLIFHGNNKSVAELEAALDYGVARVAVDSFEEIDRLGRVAAAVRRRQRVLLRVTPGVEAHTHEYVSTGQEDQKFGFSLASGAALKAVARVLATPSLALAGVHAHIGSQIFDTAGYGLALHRMVGLLARRQGRARRRARRTRPRRRAGHRLHQPGRARSTSAEAATRLRVLLDKECSDVSLPVPRLAVEPGRAISGPTTVTLYEVGTVKQLPGLRTYVSVDGGMSDNIRPALYGARYTAALVSRRSDARTAGGHGGRQALRERRRRRPRRGAAGRPAPGRSGGGAGQRGLPPVDGQQLQPRPAAACGRCARRDGARDRQARDAGGLAAVGCRAMSGRPLRVAQLGCGVVGSAVARLFASSAADLAARVGVPLELAGIAVRRPNRARDVPVDRAMFTADALGLATRDDVDVVVEVVGGIEPARTWLVSAMKAGKSVVTANKELLAADGATLHAAAREAGVDLYFEASVAGAIPLLRPLRESLAGDRVQRVLGIVNGTTNYILSRMDDTGASFTEALEEATALGYAEPDPTADVDGFDAADQGRDSRGDRVPFPGDLGRRVPGGHLGRDGSRCGQRPGDGLHGQAARHR